MLTRLLTAITTALFGQAAGRVGGAVSAAGTLAAIGGAAAWLLGPGREWTITLNALELSGVVLAGSALLEWARRVPPPG